MKCVRRLRVHCMYSHFCGWISTFHAKHWKLPHTPDALNQIFVMFKLCLNPSFRRKKDWRRRTCVGQERLAWTQLSLLVKTLWGQRGEPDWQVLRRKGARTVWREGNWNSIRTWSLWVFLSLYHFVSMFLSFLFLLSDKIWSEINKRNKISFYILYYDV